jgi:hypothetical protein
MKRIKNIIQENEKRRQAKKKLVDAMEMIEVQKEAMEIATICIDGSTRMRSQLMAENEELFDLLTAEREQKERYRTAFLDRMNVPVIGKAWTGDDGHSEES